MKGLLKKVVSLGISICIGICVVIPLDASAYVCGDVNNDGSVTMSDIVNLNKYLSGIIEIVSYEAADVTGNYVINIIDTKILQKYLVNGVNSLPHSVPTE